VRNTAPQKALRLLRALQNGPGEIHAQQFPFNVPIEKFAQLTGRSLAGFKRDFQKIFNMSPRHWLQEKRKKPSAIYLDLGFESLSHFSASFKKRFGKAPTAWGY
jgi:AraC-like DNA-binding protein